MKPENKTEINQGQNLKVVTNNSDGQKKKKNCC
jgi:hypothetical protein